MGANSNLSHSSEREKAVPLRRTVRALDRTNLVASDCAKSEVQERNLGVLDTRQFFHAVHHLELARKVRVGTGLRPDDFADLPSLWCGNAEPGGLVLRRVLAQSMPNLVEHHVRGRHVLMRFGELLGKELPNALVLPLRGLARSRWHGLRARGH